MLDLLAGRYPAEEFSELRPRIVWDRLAGTVRGRAGAQRLAVTSGGTIPDRGLYGVFLPDGTRVGELDEEMVYESRVGRDVPAGRVDLADRGHHLRARRGHPGAGPARQDAVLARRRPGSAARARPGAGRVRPRRSAAPAAATQLRPAPHRARLDERAAANLLAYLDEQAEATGVVPDDRTHRRRAVPRRDRRLADLHLTRRSAPGCTPRGRMALRARLAEHFGATTPELAMWSDDGIVIRLPEAADDAAARRAAPATPTRSRAGSWPHCPAPPLFAARFREAAARALLLPAPPTRPAHAAVAATPARRRPAGGRRQVPELPDPAGGHPRVLQRRVRPAGAARGAERPPQSPDPGGPGRHAHRLAVRPVAAVRLDRRLHVRGRRAARRTPGRGAGARPRPAARPARRRGAARRCSTPTSSTELELRAATADRGSCAPATPTSCTTCCACSAR